MVEDGPASFTIEGGTTGEIPRGLVSPNDSVNDSQLKGKPSEF